MVSVTFIEHDGEQTEIDIEEGWTLMQAAVANGVDGMEAECGGACCCATCHCYIDEAFVDKLAEPAENEDGMLEEVVAERKPNSRLACQIKVTSDLEGMTVRLPEAQS